MRVSRKFLIALSAALALLASVSAAAGKTEPKPKPRPVAVAAYGDSWTMVNVGGADWETYLSKLLPRGSSVADRGVSGEDSGDIGFREGGVVLRLASPVTLHAGSAAPVQVTVKAPITFNEHGDQIPVTLGTVHGRLQFGSWSGGTFTSAAGGNPAGRLLSAAFTPDRAHPGSYRFAAGTQVVSPTAKPDQHKVQILWQGGNDEDLPDDSKLAVKGTLEATNAEVRYLSAHHNNKFLIVSVLVNGYEVPALEGRAPMHLQWIHAMNAGLKQRYPKNYVDLTDFLSAHARGIARETGTQLSGDDLKAASMGAVPNAFTIGDGVHLNAQIRRLVQAPMFAQKLKAMGWD